jgi:hypothetical protein
MTHSLRNVIWLADTNYRIDLDNDTVRSLAMMDNFDALLAADQVRPSLSWQYNGRFLQGSM